MKIAVVQVRGAINMTRKVKDTLKFLKLIRKNSCVIVELTDSVKGMLLKVKDYVTWGEIDKETAKELLAKRGRIVGNKSLTENYLKEKVKLDFDGFVNEFFEGKKKLKEIPGVKSYFRLHPPRKGYERGGIKKPFSLGGVLGYRKDTINDLIRRMI
ncbi:50S ribosomal protein L30 [Candidatus Woesearchaeota archaeon]|nr:50S ribosomal protein L30 [Candidatus Woesearchaeota archaeon]